jgi:hypothetical protein
MHLACIAFAVGLGINGCCSWVGMSGFSYLGLGAVLLKKKQGAFGVYQ